MENIKRITLFCFLYLATTPVFAGFDILFCTNPDNMNTCKEGGGNYILEGEQTSLQIMVVNKDKLAVSKLRYMIFFMKDKTEGTLYADLALKVNPEELFALKKIFFYKPGKYKIDILNAETNIPISISFVTIDVATK